MGCEPSLTAAGFCDVHFKEAAAEMLPVVPTASDTLQMLLRLCKNLCGSTGSQSFFPPPLLNKNHLSQEQSPPCCGSLRGGDPAVHFHVCEVLHVLRALWGGDGGHNVLQAQEHGEEQDQEESQEGQEQPHVHIEARIFVCCCVYFSSQSWKVGTAGQVSAELEGNLSHRSLSALVHFLYLPSDLLSPLSRLTQEVRRGNSAQMAGWLQQELLHPLGVEAAAHTAERAARDRPVQIILHLAVIMTTSITLVLYTSFWLLFHPKNTLGLLLVGHLVWMVKSFGSSLKLSCEGWHSFGLCKCCFSRQTEQSAFCQLLSPTAGGLSLGELGKVVFCFAKRLGGSLLS